MRVLIVDDDAGLRQSLALLLQEAGYDVVTEGDPEQALTRSASGTFDLILCDVRMPKMDGVTFLRRYRADGGQALLIMMSAYGSEDSALPALGSVTFTSRMPRTLSVFPESSGLV